MRIIERQLTEKCQHREKSKFGGTENTANHGQFVLDNIDPTTLLYNDDGAIGKSKDMNTRLTIGSTVHSKGEFVNPDDYHRTAFEKRHDQVEKFYDLVLYKSHGQCLHDVCRFVKEVSKEPNDKEMARVYEILTYMKKDIDSFRYLQKTGLVVLVI